MAPDITADINYVVRAAVAVATAHAADINYAVRVAVAAVHAAVIHSGVHPIAAAGMAAHAVSRSLDLRAMGPDTAVRAADIRIITPNVGKDIEDWEQNQKDFAPNYLKYTGVAKYYVI